MRDRGGAGVVAQPVRPGHLHLGQDKGEDQDRRADLWAELQSGETTLVVGRDGRVQRRLRVVKVVVRPNEVPSAHSIYDNSVQRLPDGASASATSC